MIPQTLVSFFSSEQEALDEGAKLRELSYRVAVAGPADLVMLRDGAQELDGLDDRNVSTWFVVVGTTGFIAT